VDPITIGQFIEKYEHTVLERGEHWNRNEIFSKINERFHGLEMFEIVHITVLKALAPEM
jgi:hypothetical protein